MADTEKVERLGERLIAAGPKLGQDEQRVGLAPIRSLAAAAPVFDREVRSLRARRSRVFETPWGAGRVCSGAQLLHFVHFFASERAAREWTAEHPGTFAVTVDEGFRLGQRTSAATFGAALDGAGIAA